MIAGELLPPGVTHAGDLVSLRSADGRELRARVVHAPAPRARLLYLHGIESHGAWFLAAAERLAARGFTTWMVDRRGSGLSRGSTALDDDSCTRLLEDVEAARRSAGEPLLLVGLSWGGKLAVASCLARPAGIRGLVLVTPGLVPRVDLSPWRKACVAVSLLFGGAARFRVPIEPSMFTGTPIYLDYIRRDPLRLQRVSARFLASSRALDRRIRDAGASLDVPTMMLLAEHDRIIDNDATADLLARLCARTPDVHIYSDTTHSIQFDETDRMVCDIAQFEKELP